MYLCRPNDAKSKGGYRGVEQLVARRAHNPKVVSSSLAPATKETKKEQSAMVALFGLDALRNSAFSSSSSRGEKLAIL